MCYFSKQALVLVGTFIKLPKTYYPLSYFSLCIQITKDILPFELLFIVHPNYQRHITLWVTFHCASKLPKTYYPLSYFYCASAIFLKSWKRAWSMLQKVLKIKMYSSGNTRESWILRKMLEWRYLHYLRYLHFIETVQDYTELIHYW